MEKDTRRSILDAALSLLGEHGASRLTLNREDGDKKVYTMTISGKTMTLKSGAGGYKLERE